MKGGFYMTLKEWAKANGLEEVYKQYIKEVENIQEQCEREGYPSNGSNYELRVASLQRYYPELFGDLYDD